jgi:hypothetical protein
MQKSKAKTEERKSADYADYTDGPDQEPGTRNEERGED